MKRPLLKFAFGLSVSLIVVAVAAKATVGKRHQEPIPATKPNGGVTTSFEKSEVVRHPKQKPGNESASVAIGELTVQPEQSATCQITNSVCRETTQRRSSGETPDWENGYIDNSRSHDDIAHITMNSVAKTRSLLERLVQRLRDGST